MLSPEIIKERNEKDPENEYVISCIEDYIKDVKSENPELEEVSGELVIAKHMRIHKSIFSSRSDLKVMNTQIQNYVTNVMEPLLTLSYNLGNDYPHEAVGEIWKLLISVNVISASFFTLVAIRHIFRVEILQF